jgi:hypothetical protein
MDRYDIQPIQAWILHLVANACQTIAVKFQVLFALLPADRTRQQTAERIFARRRRVQPTSLHSSADFDLHNNRAE